jgi:hypothetical protein
VAASAISSGTERNVVEFAARSLFQKALSRPDLVQQVMDKAKREGWLSAIQAARNRLDEETALGALRSRWRRTEFSPPRLRV